MISENEILSAVAETNRKIGILVKNARRSHDLTQKEFAAKLGISHQQIQKYEAGTNRISAGMLLTIASILEIPLQSLVPDFSRLDDSEEEVVEIRQECLEIILNVEDKDALLALRIFMKKLGGDSI